MTTQYHDEHHDVDTSVVEHLPAQEHTESAGNSGDSITTDAVETVDAETVHVPQSESPITSPSSETSVPSPEEAHAPEETQPDTVEAAPVASQSETEVSSPATTQEPVGEGTDVRDAETVVEPGVATEEQVALAATEAPLEEIRPFTAFIEEFRQAEEARLQETPSHTFPFETLQQASVSSEQQVSTGVELPALLEEAPVIGAIVEESGTHDAAEHSTGTLQETLFEENMQKEQETSVTPATSVTPTASEETLPISPTLPTPSSTPVERPVSPLLRPASRLRMPRHGLGRTREEIPTPTASVAPTQEQPAQSETPAEPEQPKPARRYRFDRPATSNGVTSPVPSAAPQPRTEQSYTNGASVTQETKVGSTTNGNSTSTTQEPSVARQQPPVQEPVQTENINAPVVTAPSPISEQDRRRRHGHERAREKEQPAASIAGTPVAPGAPVVSAQAPSASIAEITTPVEPMTQAEEIALEDLPPLEYAELQKANSRRRRRHRSNNTATSVASTSITKVGTSSPTVEQAVPVVAPLIPTAPLYTPQVAEPVLPASPASTTPNQYSIISGYTVGQMNQGGENSGPFMGPEPSPARGSIVTRDGRTARAESQRTHVYPARPAEGGTVSSNSVQQLASVLSQAIQTQTDRMVAELRRANQQPPSISVTMPPFPSNERVGVFVDVANLLYSARTMRIAVDFGKLLDFLRGNRRLVRAHAYCPTSPQAGDEQMFLQAVKGLGYRITTKNYKTFSSGAKKADLDLDLCMDVVRLVDGRAVDCVVLVSGDSDFMPMLDYCSDHGVRVEVAAFDEAMSQTLRQSCDLFINLSMLEEIRS